MSHDAVFDIGQNSTGVSLRSTHGINKRLRRFAYAAFKSTLFAEG
jgi:hypothetical protein